MSDVTSGGASLSPTDEIDVFALATDERAAMTYMPTLASAKNPALTNFLKNDKIFLRNLLFCEIF